MSADWKIFEFASLRYDAGLNTLFFKVNQDIEVDVHVIKEMLRYAQDTMGEKRHYCVIDFGSNVDSTTEGRKLYADSKYIQTYRIADAFIVKSLALKMVANFFIQVTRPKVLTRMFNDEESALNWLQSLKVKLEV